MTVKDETENPDVRAEIEEIEKAIAEMDTETLKLKELTETIEEEEAAGVIDSVDVDKRSVYVGNVDYGSTPEEIQEHFKACGAINRITILVDRYTGSPKGFAYVEFAEEQGVANAVLLNDSLFRARQLKVTHKRTNIPGMSSKGAYKGSKGKSPTKGKGKGKQPVFGKGYTPYPPVWAYGGGSPSWGKGAKGKYGKGGWYM
eukprot:GEMP01086201.1.p1 GENE.GEMP01086201.1~~GEMP01086201.1.p1  ORF type:complete len:201 (+),score=48.40 GEMP01086201.1:111-713(+)